MKILFLLCVGLFFCCSGNDNKTGNEKDITKKSSSSARIDLLKDNNLDQWQFFLKDSTVAAKAIWSISDSIVKCTGAVNGYMRTKKDFANYKLSFEWRWPEEPGNSGVLLHIKNPDKVWPVCIEAQLKSGNAGDIIVFEGSKINELADADSRRLEKKADSSEKEIGEWNLYEITCSENQIRLYINGIFQNEATGASLHNGKIGLQSEGKPIEFKNIYLELI